MPPVRKLDITEQDIFDFVSGNYTTVDFRKLPYGTSINECMLYYEMFIRIDRSTLYIRSVCSGDIPDFIPVTTYDKLFSVCRDNIINFIRSAILEKIELVSQDHGGLVQPTIINLKQGTFANPICEYTAISGK